MATKPLFSLDCTPIQWFEFPIFNCRWRFVHISLHLLAQFGNKSDLKKKRLIIVFTSLHFLVCKENKCFVVWNVLNKIHVREKKSLVTEHDLCFRKFQGYILIFTWSWSIIHPDLLFEPKRNLKGGGSGLVKICKARRSSRERFCEQSTRAETLKMAAHTQT